MLVTQSASSALGHLEQSDSPAREAEKEENRGLAQQGAKKANQLVVQLAQCDRPSKPCSQGRGASMHVTQPVQSAPESMDHRDPQIAKARAHGRAHGKKEHRAATAGRRTAGVKKKTKEWGAARATKGRLTGTNPLGGQYVSNQGSSPGVSAAQRWVQMRKEKQGAKRHHRLGQAYTRLKKTALIAAIVWGSFVLTVAGSGGGAPEVRVDSKRKEYDKEYGEGSRKRQRPSKTKKRQKAERGRRRKEDMEPD
jgi:hypothetical protein